MNAPDKASELVDACEQSVNPLRKRRAETLRQQRPALTTKPVLEAFMAKPIPTDIPDSVKARFWAKVDVRGPDECWEWLGGKASTRVAYGRFSIQRRHPRPAHQVAWEIHHNEPFPKGKIGCHACDNPGCVNPAHIWPGTVSENARDAVAKGLWPAKRKTHCIRGHALEGENREPMWGGGSRCRECRRLLTRERTRRCRERARANG